MAMRKPQSPIRLVMNAFLPAEALASSVNQNEVGAGPHALPADEGDQQVAAEHQHQHREDEQVQVDEVLGIVPVAVHVADRVQVDQRAHTGDEQRHRDRQRIGQEPDVHLQGAHRDPTEQRLDELALLALLAEQPGIDDHGGHEAATAHGCGQPTGRRLTQPPPEGEEDQEPGERQRGDQPDEIKHGFLLTLRVGRRRRPWREVACAAGRR
jgi:hypothetical protein